MPVQRGKFMEQKKTLWIIAAVGVFLLVVLGVPAILHYPARNPVPAYASISPVEKKASQSGWTKPSADLTAPAKVNDLVVLADNATVYSQNTTTPANNSTTIDLNALKNELVTDSQLQSQPQNINITVNIPETDTKSAAKTEVQYVAKADTKADAAENTVKTVQKAETKSSASKTTKTVAQANANTSSKKSESTAAKAEPKKTQYWVQVAAYSNKKGAEGARSVLDENKIPSDIFTYRDNKDKLYYRVRVGPYTTKSEAEYWRTRIIKINDIENAGDSYITSTTI